MLSSSPSTGAGDNVIEPSGGVEAVAAVPAAALNREEVVPDPTGLRPIGGASYGPWVGPEVVIGQADRVQLTNTAVHPWRVHASLLITAGDGSRWIGTGWFIGRHSLATAGHCVYIRYSGVAGRVGACRASR